MTQTHISVRGLTHEFASGAGTLTALESIDLDVDHGAFVSVVGPSGAGKTTLLKLIGGLTEPTAGSIEIDGLPPAEAQRQRAIGFVLQDPSLLPWRTAQQNIALPLELNDNGIADHGAELTRLVEAVGLGMFRDYHPHQLSGGMRQRVALARALVFDPAVLLMDEPLGSLDEMTRGAMRYELIRLWESSRKTVVFVTHSIQEAVLLSDSVVVMSPQPGQILAEVELDLPRPRKESLEDSQDFMDRVRRIKAILTSGASRGSPSFEAAAPV